MNKKIKQLLVFVFTIIIVIFFHYLLNNNIVEAPHNNENGASSGQNGSLTGENTESPPPSRVETINLLAVGDLMFHDVQLQGAYNKQTGEYDFYPSFEVIAPYIQAADFAVANLETTMAGKEHKYSSFPVFNTPETLSFALKKAGFNLVSTANNHALDRLEDGVYKTIEHLEAAGLSFTGTARSQDERTNPVIKEIKGINLAFLAYTYGTNGMIIPAGKDYIINLIDEELIKGDIQRARASGADMVIIFVHWGEEYQTSPSPTQKELAQKIVAIGGDIILGSHPHVIQNMEFIRLEGKDGLEKEGFVIYSLGNFISNQHYLPPYIPTDKVEFGLLLNLEIEKNFETAQTRISGVTYTPTWVHRQWRHRILPVTAIVSGGHNFPLEQVEANRVQAVWSSINEQIKHIEAVSVD